MSDPYQVAIIGGGPAGYVAAIRAAQLGLKTVLIEKRPTLGGTCLNIGCIPSKALLASSEHYHFAAHRAATHGIKISGLEIDLPAMMKRKDEVVANLTKGIAFLMKKNKIEVLTGTASLTGPASIEVDLGGSKKTVQAAHIILATGSVPVEIPSLKFDGKTVVSSDQAIAFDRVPKSLLVIGAGAIGLELGSVWARLGSEVTVLEFLPRIAPGFDLEAAQALQKSLQKQGLKFHLNTKVQGVKTSSKGAVVTALKEAVETTFEAEKVLVAVGRKPFTEGLGLERAGVQLTDKGRIKVDTHLRTTSPTIYAIGDVVDGPMLAHKAEEEGVAVAERIAGRVGHVNYDLVPGIIYTHPEVAGVGLTSEAAKEKGLPVKIGKFSFQANGRALAADANEGFVKIITHAETDRVLGAHIVAAQASELLAECVSVMEFGGSAEDIARTMHGHPTMSEAVKEAAWAAWSAPLHG
jgi:dihydrolipoamide dehydrogenase